MHGTSLDFDGVLMLKQDKNARAEMAIEVKSAINWVVKNNNYCGDFYGDPMGYISGVQTTSGRPEGPYNTKTTKWKSAVGGFFAGLWGKTWKNSGGGYSMFICIEMGDRYNFHHTGNKIRFVRAVGTESYAVGGGKNVEFASENDFADLPYVSQAKPYNRRGGVICLEIEDIQNITTEKIEQKLE